MLLKTSWASTHFLPLALRGICMHSVWTLKSAAAEARTPPVGAEWKLTGPWSGHPKSVLERSEAPDSIYKLLPHKHICKAVWFKPYLWTSPFYRELFIFLIPPIVLEAPSKTLSKLKQEPIWWNLVVKYRDLMVSCHRQHANGEKTL